MKYYYNSIKPVMLAYQVVTQHSTSRIRILQITAPVVFGGAERVLLNIGRLIDKSRFTISYCVFLNPNRKQNELYGTLTDIDRDVSVIRMFRKVNINVFDLVRIIRKTHPHILHTHGYRPDIVGLIASRITHTPIVSTVHGWTRTSRKVRVYEYIQRKIMRYVDAVIPVSKQINNDLITEKVMPSRMFRINNIIDYETCSMDPVINLRKEYNIGMKCPVVGTIGRLSLEKGHIHLLKAVPLLWKSYPDIKVVIVGTGDQEAGLKEYVRMNKMENAVMFCGFQKNPQAFYELFDIFVLPSLTEGIPLVLLEAMHFKKPIVASNVGGIPELIQRGYNGELVSPGDPRAIADKILNLLQNIEYAQAIAESGHDFLISKFDPGTWIKQMEDVYQTVYDRRYA